MTTSNSLPILAIELITKSLKSSEYGYLFKIKSTPTESGKYSLYFDSKKIDLSYISPAPIYKENAKVVKQSTPIVIPSSLSPSDDELLAPQQYMFQTAASEGDYLFLNQQTYNDRDDALQELRLRNKKDARPNLPQLLNLCQSFRLSLCSNSGSKAYDFIDHFNSRPQELKDSFLDLFSISMALEAVKKNTLSPSSSSLNLLCTSCAGSEKALINQLVINYFLTSTFYTGYLKKFMLEKYPTSSLREINSSEFFDLLSRSSYKSSKSIVRMYLGFECLRRTLPHITSLSPLNLANTSVKDTMSEGEWEETHIKFLSTFGIADLVRKDLKSCKAFEGSYEHPLVNNFLLDIIAKEEKKLVEKTLDIQGKSVNEQVKEQVEDKKSFKI